MQSATLRHQAGPQKMPTLVTEAIAVGAAGLLVASVLEGASDQDRLIAYCQYGSAIGSATYVMRAKLYESDGVLFAFLGNAGFAFMISPLLCRSIAVWCKIQTDLSLCLCVAGFAAYLATWATAKIAPVVGDKLESSARGANVRQILGRVLGMEIPTTRKPRRKVPHD